MKGVVNLPLADAATLPPATYVVAYNVQHLIPSFSVPLSQLRGRFCRSRHAWQASTSAITVLSYSVVQAFRGTTATRKRFWSIHRSKASIRVETFLHIPSSHFLCRLQEEVKSVNTDNLGGRQGLDRISEILQALTATGAGDKKAEWCHKGG